MDAQVRETVPGDVALLPELFRAAFGGEWDAAEWAWKYERNPHRGTSVVAVADGRAVGFFGALATRYRGARGDLPGLAAADVMTHPACRRLGRTTVFEAVGRDFAERNGRLGAPFDFGFPNERARRAEERLLDVKTIEPAGELERPFAKRAARRRWLRRTRRGGRFGGGDAPLAEALHARPGWRTDRSPATLNWRLFERPGVPYELFRVVDLAGRTRAWAVARVVGDRALLVDLQARDEGGGDVPDLLDAVEEGLDGTGAARLAFRGARSGALYGRLRELGFAETTSDTHFVVRAFRPDFDVTAEGRVFDYRFLDHDVF